MKKYLPFFLTALFAVSTSAGAAEKNPASAAYEKLVSYKTEQYSQQSVADFNASLQDEDLTALFEAHAAVTADISSDDENYDFITKTLAASLNEIYYELVEKDNETSISGYLTKNGQDGSILFDALYNISYTLPEPSELTVAQRDDLLETFRTEMQQYVDSLNEDNITNDSIETLLSQKAAGLAENIASDYMNLSFEINHIETFLF